MSGFPAVDPIPLPAPIWLFKGLHIATLSLHFVAVQMLLGGLLAATAISLVARRSESRTAAAALARRLPVVMTYVINLGVPPLLFAQVLYGRALYTSSVLIGALWISVIGLLMACYWLLYRFSARLEAGRTAWWIGAAAWLLAGGIAKIYTANMTLMLRPEVWQAMYANSAAGAQAVAGDPALFPRWIAMLCASLMMAGLWMLYLAGRGTFTDRERQFLARAGGGLTLAMSGLVFYSLRQVIAAQPGAVQSALRSHPLYGYAAMGWVAAALLAVVLAVAALVWKRVSPAVSWGAVVAGAFAAASIAIYRDGIRDVTLLTKGFDVWQRVVATNWSVVGLFLALFVAGLGALGWLISVVARASKVKESVA